MSINSAYFTARHLGQINRVTHWLGSSRMRPFILCYHQVDRDEFRRHIRFLKKRFPIVPLTELTERLRAGVYEAVCALTLDDCIREDTVKAMDAVGAENASITFYLPTDYVPGEKSMWWIKIRHLTASLQKVLFGSDTITLGGALQRIKIKDMIIEHWLASNLQTGELEDRVDEWMVENGVNPSDMPERLRVISSAMVKKYAESSFAQFESHTASHPFLRLCSKDELERELSESKRAVEEMTGQPVTSLCYPYGSAKAIGVNAPEVASHHYTNATTLIYGNCGPDSNSFFLPRIGIYPGDGLKELAGKIYHYQTKQIISELRR